MSTRPHIPAEIERDILIESGHRCAVCGAACPLERAHIIPWHKAKKHNAEDMICLCANCHERADNEGWGEKTLREYKVRPWIARNFENKVNIVEKKTKIQLSIDMEFNEFDQKWALWIRYGLAAFLDISPEKVRIESTEEGSTKLNIVLPDESTKRLFNVFIEDREELARFLHPLKLKHIKFIESKAIVSKKERVQKSRVEYRKTHAATGTGDMRELVSYIAASLVDNPGDIDVWEFENDQTTVLELRVAKEDLGKVIGKQGRTAQALRTILSAVASKIKKRTVLEIIE